MAPSPRQKKGDGIGETKRGKGTKWRVVRGKRRKGADEVTVPLGDPHPMVKVYDPTIGTKPIQSHREIRSLKLILSEHPLILATEYPR